MHGKFERNKRPLERERIARGLGAKPTSTSSRMLVSICSTCVVSSFRPPMTFGKTSTNAARASNHQRSDYAVLDGRATPLDGSICLFAAVPLERASILSSFALGT